VSVSGMSSSVSVSGMSSSVSVSGMSSSVNVSGMSRCSVSVSGMITDSIDIFAVMKQVCYGCSVSVSGMSADSIARPVAMCIAESAYTFAAVVVNERNKRSVKLRQKQ
jgi:hypothetical protein